MTDKEIEKAKGHFKYGISHDIYSEPVLSYAKTVLWAFEEIERQKAEIDGLIAGQESLQKDIKEKKEIISAQADKIRLLEMVLGERVAEVAELKSDLIIKTNDYENIKNFYDNAIQISQKMNDKLVKAYKKLQNVKAEVIKEFAERLKQSCYTHSDITGYQSTVVDIASIDNLVKEMTES